MPFSLALPLLEYLQYSTLFLILIDSVINALTLNLMFHWLIFDNVVISLAIFALLYGLFLCLILAYMFNFLDG